MFDLLDATELSEAEVIDVAASDGVFLCLCCSMELSEAVSIEGDALRASGGIGSEGSEGSGLRWMPEKLLVMRSRVVSGS